MPFELDRIYGALDECTVFIAVGTSGVVEPAASFAVVVRGHAGTIYVRPEVQPIRWYRGADEQMDEMGRRWGL